jgi:hypothetical protein
MVSSPGKLFAAMTGPCRVHCRPAVAQAPSPMLTSIASLNVSTLKVVCAAA